MTSQKVYWKMHDSVYREESMFIGALQGHSGNNLDISKLSHTKIEKGSTHHFCTIFGFQDMKIQSNQDDLYLSLMSPMDPCPDPKYKPYLHMKSHHGRLCVIDLEAAQNSLDIFRQRTGVSCAMTQFRPSSSQRSSPSKTDQKGT